MRDLTHAPRRDDAKGPVTNCELYTLEPEDLLNQAFDDDNRAVYLIMKAGGSMS